MLNVYWKAGGPRSSDIRAMSIGRARRLENAQFCADSCGLLLFGTAVMRADEGKPNMNGIWKLDPVRSELDQTNKDLALVIEEKGQNIHVKETRGPNPKEDVSEFTCSTMGKDCPMQDGGDKATVSVYYNGPLLVVLKTHGRKGSLVEKQRLSLSGDSLIIEITHIDPEGKAEKLVFSKAK
jgi:hypothetical protein